MVKDRQSQGQTLSRSDVMKVATPTEIAEVRAIYGKGEMALGH
jgi:hypothetical protein